jgi:4-amino-4-deoxy-L-arabinose transferase-like glycosyltransferase
MEDTAVRQGRLAPGASHAVAGRPWRARALDLGQAAVLVMLSLALNLAGNDRTGLWDRDEPRYAVSVREMRARGDWLYPTFNGEPRYHKPILIYWLMGMSTALTGDNPFGARLASSLAGSAAVLGVWVLARNMLGRRGGLLAALALGTAPIVVAESKFATTDAALALFVFGCQACLWVLGRRASRLAACSFWALLALACLTKGPVGPALVAAASLLAWWWGWPSDAWRRLHWRSGIILFLLLTAPWFVAISIASHGAFLRFAVGKEIVHRVASDMETHGGFPGYYAVVAALVFYPWSAFLPTALVAAWRVRKGHPELGFLLGWAIGPVILLECVRTKLIHYLLPAFPAWALLVAWLVVALTGEDVNIRRWPLGRLALALLAGIGLAIAAVLVAGATMTSIALRGPILLVALVITGGTFAALTWLQQAASEKAVLALAAAWAIVLLIAGGWLIPLCEPYRTSRVVGEKLARLSAELGVDPVLLEYREPGVIYAIGRPIPTASDRDEFYGHLRNGRSVLTVALPRQMNVMRERFGLFVTPVDQVDGFVLSKGKSQTLQIAVVRDESRRASAPASRAAARLGGTGAQETLVK